MSYQDHMSGFDAGREDGYEKGYSDGNEDGYDRGYKMGYEEGSEAGYLDGHAAGVAQITMRYSKELLAYRIEVEAKDELITQLTEEIEELEQLLSDLRRGIDRPGI